MNRQRNCTRSDCETDDTLKEGMQRRLGRQSARVNVWTRWKVPSQPCMGDTDTNLFEKRTWVPLPKPWIVDSGADQTVMPRDWLNHLLTESDGSRANDFYTPADGNNQRLQ